MAMKQNNKRHILVRYGIVVGFMLLFSTVIVWDLLKTTTIQAAAWNDKANSVLMTTTPIEPERGKLLADNGIPFDESKAQKSFSGESSAAAAAGIAARRRSNRSILRYRSLVIVLA